MLLQCSALAAEDVPRDVPGECSWGIPWGLSLGTVPLNCLSPFVFSVRSNVRMTLQDFLEQRLGKHR